MNNSKMNYLKKFLNILYVIVLSVPLILLLVACVFPIKQTTNNYNKEIGDIEKVLDYDGTLSFLTLNVDEFTYMNDDTDVFNINLSPDSDRLSGNTLYLRNLLDITINIPESGIIYLYGDDPITINRIDFINEDLTRILKFYNNDTFIQNLVLDNNLEITFVEGYVNIEITKLNCRNFDVQDVSGDYAYGNANVYKYVTTDFENIVSVNDIKQPNYSILYSFYDFYTSPLNSWYSNSLLSFFGVSVTNHDMFSYMMLYPIWLFWVSMLKLFVDILTLFPKLARKLFTRGD